MRVAATDPQDDVADTDQPEVSLADADVTASSINSNDDPQNDDLNDDGLPDVETLDDDHDSEDPDEDAATEVDIAIDPNRRATAPKG